MIARLAGMSALMLLAALGGCSAQPRITPAEPAAPTDASAQANAFFERTQDEVFELNPMWAAQLGYRIRYDEWDDISEAGERARLQLARRHLDELRAIDRAALDAETRLSWDLFEYLQQQRIAAYRWRNHEYLFSHQRGLQSSAPAFLVNSHQVRSEDDAEAYVRRLERMGDYLLTGLESSRTAADRGVVAPRFVFAGVASSARNVITGRPFDDGPAMSPLLADFIAKLQVLDLPAARKAELEAAAEAALEGPVRAAYQQVIAWAEEMAARASTDDGAWKLPHGEAFYAHRLASYTTTPLSADEIHAIGLREVARIHDDMRAIMDRVGFEGSLEDFFEYVRTDDRFYYPDTPEGRAEYLAEATRLIDAMRARLPELFNTLPKADVVVRAVEPFREKTAGKAFYQRPAADGSRPGTYYVNLYRMRDMPKTEMEALAYHEGLPGHHMQIAIALEQQSLPRFRRFGRVTAYSEGWGLYSERLPKEIGLYQDPYSDFGRLTLELLRAVRLVVDTGLHAKRWTREDVIRYHLDNTPLPEGSIVRATERYIVNPGQATAYTIGMLKILELRDRAASELGERFDLRGFHDAILHSGPVPLTILEGQVASWIESQR